MIMTVEKAIKKIIQNRHRRQSLEEHLRLHGIRYEEFELLYVLSAQTPCYIEDLSDHLHMDRAYVRIASQKLDTKGLIDKKLNGRKLELKLSRKGKSILEKFKSL